MKIGIIGGSGFYEIDGFDLAGHTSVDTPYGAPSDKYTHYTCGGHDIYFLPRHSSAHNIAPHKINYRANISGFALLGISRILSVSAVGGITGETGELVVPDDGIDLTSGRISTYFDQDIIRHVDMTSPYCPGLRGLLLAAAQSAGVPLRDGGVCICTNGPRLETAAEIRAYAKWGADTVGMTLFPECTLAREKGICYANISVITNPAAGRSRGRLTTSEVTAGMAAGTQRLKLILKAFLSIHQEYACYCGSSPDDTTISK